MAVIQISKLQVRRGLQENLPQLASAELAWSVDQRRLFIGNGTLSEGAPEVGNTEILTEYTDILSVVKSYYFKGDESGWTSQTGPSIFAPVVRTLQNKLDEDRISVRNFGVIGDGLTDNTITLAQAISQVYPSSQLSNEGIRRVLYFPAGVYLVSDEFALPFYATIAGDGKYSTVIQQMSSSARSIFTFSDSAGHISPSIGLSGASSPNSVKIENLTLYNTTDNYVLYIDSLSNLIMREVKLTGSQTTPTTAGTSKSLINIISNQSAVYNISADKCDFTNASYAANINSGNYGAYGINITNSYFNNLYNGVSASGSTIYPRGVRILNSVFDLIANTAISSLGYSSIISGFNYYGNVGNGLSSSPVSSVLYFENPENYSLTDTFTRSVANSTTYPIIRTTGTFSSTPSFSTVSSAGSLKTTPGSTEIISQNSTLANTSLSLSRLTVSNAIIDYTLSNASGANVKVGTLKISNNINSSNQFYYEDDFVEYPAGTQYLYGINSPTATDLTFVTYGNNIILAANTSATSGNVTFKYNIRQFN